MLAISIFREITSTLVSLFYKKKKINTEGRKYTKDIENTVQNQQRDNILPIPLSTRLGIHRWYSNITYPLYKSMVFIKKWGKFVRRKEFFLAYNVTILIKSGVSGWPQPKITLRSETVMGYIRA